MGIATPGVGSGLDINGIVSKLMAIERQPLQQLQKQDGALQTKISAFGRLQGALSTLQDAAKALQTASLWQSTSATTSDANVAAVTVTGAGSPGSYSIKATQLAQRQSAASAVQTSADVTLAAGALHFQLGKLNASGQFPPADPAKQVKVDITATDTLAQIRDKINGAKAGVIASIVTDGTGVRLVMRSADTGAANAFRVTATNPDGTTAGPGGLATLTYDPSTGATNQMTGNQAARDAAFTVDGLAMTSASNKLTGVIEGVTVELKKVVPESVDIQIASDRDTMKRAIAKFTDAYNAVSTLIGEQTRYNASNKTAGPLQGNSVAVGVQNQLRAVLGQEVVGSTAGAFARLSDIGIAVQANGTLAANSTKLDAALANPTAVKALFSTTATDSTREGVAVRFEKLASGLVGADGTISTATDSFQRRKKSISGQQEALQRRLDATQARLLKQYNDLDRKLGTIQQVDFSKLSTNYGQGD